MPGASRPRDPLPWDELREEIQAHGLRNSLLIAIAPTATIASIAGCYECIEPQVSNLFKRETLSGDFLQINRYLVEELKQLGLWTDEIRDAIKLADGSVQGISEIARGAARDLSHGLGVADARADRPGRASAARTSTRASRSICSWRIRTSAQLSSMYMYAWKQRPEDDLLPALAARDADREDHGAGKAACDRRVVCSLENPESCEACQ